MGILTGQAICEAAGRGDIVIDPFDTKRLNPNSYNLRLGPKLIVYKEKVLDPKLPNEYQYRTIPDDGFLIEPNEIYLGATLERTFTDKFVPMIEGRSSMGRLGLFIHITAGFGDIGFNGHWTLELTSVKPVKVYRDMEIAQIYYHKPDGEIDRLYKSRKYQNNYGVQPSLSYLDFLNEGHDDE